MNDDKERKKLFLLAIAIFFLVCATKERSERTFLWQFIDFFLFSPFLAELIRVESFLMEKNILRHEKLIGFAKFG